MKNKAFTLIELLAVIVILAIIALIATPTVLNVIEDSRKSAAEASARNIVSAAKTYYMSEIMSGRTIGSIDLSGDTLKYDGDQASKGEITFTDGKPSGTMYIGGYCVTININGNVTSEKKPEDECEITVKPIEPTTYAKYNNGAELLYDPVNNVKCTDIEVETNVSNYKESHYDDITGLKDGCMKWYAFLDNEDSEIVNLILDHNTTNYVSWNASGGTTPDTVNAKLQNDITNWNAEVKATARLISANEVNSIAPTNPNWDINDWETYYNLHTGTTTSYTGEAGSNTYDWLFDNTYGCIRYGCNAETINIRGYWASSFVPSEYAWFVSSSGFLNANAINDDSVGIRPVIEVDKSIFK